MLLKQLNIVTQFFSRNLILHVAQQSFIINGRWQKPNPAHITQTIKGNLQPLTAQELTILSEGSRISETIKLYTLVKIYTTGQRNNTESDLIQDGEKVYKAIKVYDRSETSGQYKVVLEYLPEGIGL